MEFKKKLKIRLYTAITILITGIIFIALGVIKPTDTLSSFGLMFAIIGIARIRQYKHIMKNADTLRKREIMETDERNILIWTKPRSLAASLYVIISGIAIAALYILNMQEIATIISYTVITFVLINWICYWIMSSKY